MLIFSLLSVYISILNLTTFYTYSQAIISSYLCIILPIIGILIGIGFILVGISLNGIAQDATFYPAGYGGDVSHLGSKEYGADYYSDSYQAMAFGANAAKNVFDLLSIALPAFFVLAGLLTICAFVHIILSTNALHLNGAKDSAQEQVLDPSVLDSNEQGGSPDKENQS